MEDNPQAKLEKEQSSRILDTDGATNLNSYIVDEHFPQDEEKEEDDGDIVMVEEDDASSVVEAH